MTRKDPFQNWIMHCARKRGGVSVTIDDIDRARVTIEPDDSGDNPTPDSPVRDWVTRSDEHSDKSAMAAAGIDFRAGPKYQARYTSARTVLKDPEGYKVRFILWRGDTLSPDELATLALRAGYDLVWKGSWVLAAGSKTGWWLCGDNEELPEAEWARRGCPDADGQNGVPAERLLGHLIYGLGQVQQMGNEGAQISALIEKLQEVQELLRGEGV